MKLLGIADERTTCDCCGKSELKRTVALQNNNLEVVYYGVCCAARALGMNGHYTTATANKFKRDYDAREERKAIYQSTCERAKELSLKTGKAQCVCKSRGDSSYYVWEQDRLCAGGFYRTPIATF